MMERTFATLDRLDVPDLSRDVDRRRASSEELRPIPEPPKNGRRVIAAVVALSVFSAAAAFGFHVWTRHQDVRPIGDAWSWAGQGWTPIADPPQRLAGAAWTWAGEHLVMWGGCTGETECSPTNEGFSYDPRTRVWNSMPTAPRPGHDAVAVAEGDRVFFFTTGREGQVFDVTSNTWRELPIAPIEPDLAVWAGTEIIALQRVGRSGAGTAAAAYDPGTNTWHVLAKPPIEFDVASVTWTGREMIVVSGLLESGDRPTPSTVDAMAFEPATGSWRTLQGTGLYPESFASGWIAGELIAWDYYTRWRSFDPVSDTWSIAGKIPLEESECDVDGAAVGSVVFAWNCGTAAIFEGGGWTRVQGGPLEETISSPASKGETRLWRFAELVPAGNVLVLPLTGITLAKSGEACYGCPGSPESLWVYRPPSEATSSTEAPSGGLWPGISEGLTGLPAPPRLLAGAVEVWTGRGLVLWGGNRRFGDPPHFNEGYLFDARTLTWQGIAPSPLAGRSWAAAGWTGSEVVIWGGANGYAADDGVLDDGAAYDPTRDTWRTIAPAPIATPILDSVWTGSEMLIFGEGASAAYDPMVDTWRIIPDPPLDLSQAVAVWTGREAVLFGAYLSSSNNASQTETAVGAAYDPISMSWRSLPASDLDPHATTAVWDGAQVVALDYLLRASAFDVTDQTWASLPRMPFNACEGYPEAAATGGSMMVQFCGEVATRGPRDQRWHVVFGRGEAPFGFSPDPIAAGDAYILLGPGFETGGPQMYVYVLPQRGSRERSAWDVVAAVAALRSHYPYEPGSVPAEVSEEMRTLISSEAYAAWQDPSSGLGALWTYYTGFEVRSVVPRADSSTFEAHVRFSPSSGPDLSYAETLIVGPGVALDGGSRDLVVIDAMPG